MVPTVSAQDICPIIVPAGEVWEAMYEVIYDRSETAHPCVRATRWSGWMMLESGKYDVGGNVDGLVFVYWLTRPFPRDEGEGAVNPQFYKVCPSWDAFPGYGVCLFDDGFESGDTSAWRLAVGDE